MDPRTVLFSLIDDTGMKIPAVFWLCCLLVKKYIWSSRGDQIPLTIKGGLDSIRHTENLEALIACKNKRIGKHRVKWGTLSSIELDQEGQKVIIVRRDTRDLYEYHPTNTEG